MSGVELEIRDYDKLEETTYEIAADTDENPDRYGAEYCVRNVEQLNPQIFAWLGILDVNIWVILILMIGGGGFHHGIRPADYHHRAYLHDRRAEVFGSQ